MARAIARGVTDLKPITRNPKAVTGVTIHETRFEAQNPKPETRNPKRATQKAERRTLKGHRTFEVLGLRVLGFRV
jgi:hypothetical protein